jgi:hypothetical protein
MSGDLEFAPIEKREACPNCGYCKHCGRSNEPFRFVPYYPVYPVYPTYPTWPPYTITWGPNSAPYSITSSAGDWIGGGVWL